MTGYWITVGLAVAEVIGVISAIHALMSVRTPQGTVAWVVSLVAMPVVSVPAYWVFGRNKFQGYVMARGVADESVRKRTAERAPAVARFFATLPEEHGQMQAAEGLARIPFLVGNAVELLVDGRATFDSVFAGIDAARRYLLVQFYIVHGDRLGNQLKERLVAAAARGVRVYFLYDEVGSQGLPAAYLRELRDAGVHVSSIRTTRGAGNRFQLNFRNHRKIVVADGVTGWVGGHNVGDEYVDGHPSLGAWRDTHLRLTGPSVLGLQLAFMEDWHWATDEVPEVSWEPVPASAGNLPVLILPSGPADRLETASLMIQHALNTARRRVWIASPYFVPDEGVTAALHLAALRGVDVRIIIPARPDHRVVYLAAFAFLGDLLASGIEIYRYEAGFLHQKVILVDDGAAGVGTVNLDNRSFRLNFEITAVVADPEFATEVERMLETDLSRSSRVTRDDLEARPFWFRMAARAAYLLAPIL